MPADRLLGTLLRSLQTYTDQQDTPRLLGAGSSLLTTLNNPLNVTLLTSQLLSADAIWTASEGLRTCLQCLSVFRSAAQVLVRHERALNDDDADRDFDQPQYERTLPKEDWVRAVINGADEHSPRWKHLLAFGGLLLGFGSIEEDALSRSMRSTVESAITTATNAALQDMTEDDDLGQESVTLVLNHCFPIISDHERSRLDYDSLLPVLMRSVLHSTEGLQYAYFLGAIDLDVQPISNARFHWPERAPSYQHLQSMLKSPLLSSLGPLARLIGHCIQNAEQPWLVTAAIDDLEAFCRSLHAQWRQNKLSEINSSEESTYLDRETLEKTTPALWGLLRSTLYAVVIILRGMVARLLGDVELARDEAAPKMAMQALHILRHLYFISTRSGTTTSSQYTFVNLTALDILTSYSAYATDFLGQVKPTVLGQVPQHPLDRGLDLFFLNTAEHCTLAVSPSTNEELLFAAAAPYLAKGGNNNLLPIFEAAHSVMLAIFSAPQNADLTARHLPLYVDALFKVFPSNLSARQFRMAFKTLVRLTTPPSMVPASQPALPAVLLELLHERARQASTSPISPRTSLFAPNATSEDLMELSEQAVFILSILDTLPELQLDLLDEWLPLSASLLSIIEDSAMRDYCTQHFWQILIGGEMDPDRSSVCHAWWSTGGGREQVLYRSTAMLNGPADMSGALPASSDSRL